MENRFKPKKVLVTGGSGFIGSHIVGELIKKEYKVVSLDKVSPPFGINAACIYECVDITNARKIAKIFKDFQPDYVIHCAAKARIQPSLIDPVITYRANVMGTLNILEVCRKHGVKKIVYSASSSVYGGHGFETLPLNEDLKPLPLNPYAYAKFMGEILIEQYVYNYGLRAAILRYFNVYGPRQPSDGQYATIIGIFLRQLKEEEPLTIVPDGKQRRDFTWVGDVVNANILAMGSEAVYKGEVFNIGYGKNYSILEVADMVGGKDYPKIFIKPRTGEAKATLADISKAKNSLGWEPKVSLEQGIEFLKKEI